MNMKIHKTRTHTAVENYTEVNHKYTFLHRKSWTRPIFQSVRHKVIIIIAKVRY